MSLLHHPELRHCRRLFLRDYIFEISIGVHAFEKIDRQRIRMNIDLFVPLIDSTPQQDRLDEVVDYDFIRETIQACAQQEHIHLQETLCDRIAQQLLAHPKVHAARIISEKVDVYPDCDAVGVEIFHIKSA